MLSSKEIFSDERRIIKSKGIYVQMASIESDHSYFNVFDHDDLKKIKYMGRITDKRTHDEYCTCPDNFHRNTEDYKKTHALSFQCKHQIAYREFLAKLRQSFKDLENERD